MHDCPVDGLDDLFLMHLWEVVCGDLVVSDPLISGEMSSHVALLLFRFNICYALLQRCMLVIGVVSVGELCYADIDA